MKQPQVPDIADWMTRHAAAMEQDIFELLRIPSVSGAACDDYPYGRGCAQALDTVGQIAARLGFTLENDSYHCGTVLLPGSEQQEIGIFTHIDIVPEGQNWTGDPYQPYCREGHIFGRGSTDNKGPAVAALYLLAALRDSGTTLRNSIRLYFGCDEEAGMGDITYYLQQHAPPKLALIPDARYSVCHGEKGILDFTFAIDIAGSNLLDFTGGVAANAVPDHAALTLRGVDKATCLARLPAGHGCTVIPAEIGVTVTADGVSAHAAFPENGVSAIVKLALAVANTRLVDAAGTAALRLLAAAFGDCYGAGLEISAEDLSGKLTHVGGLLRYQDGQIQQQVNIRYPVTTDGTALQQCIRDWCGRTGVALLSCKDNPPVFTKPSHPVVQLLNRLASQELGRPFEPYTMGGGTYARKLPFAFAFGPLLQELPRPGGGGHQPDECVSIEGLHRFIKIYLRALCELDTMELNQ